MESIFAGLAFHLALLAVFGLLVGLMATGRRRRVEPAGRRWILAGALLLGLQGMLALADALALAGTLRPALLEPLETVGFIISAILVVRVGAYPRRSRPADFLALVLIFGVVAVGVVLTLLSLGSLVVGLLGGWAGLAAIGTGLAGLAALAFVIRRRAAAWPLLTAGFGALTLGAVVQLALPPEARASLLALHIGSLTGYALIAYSTLAGAVAEVAALPLPPASHYLAPPDEVAPAVASLADLTALLVTEEVGDLADLVVEGIARTLRIEMCALLTTPDGHGHFTLATGFDLIQERPVSGAPLDERDCPSIAAAVSARQVLLLDEKQHQVDLKYLRSVLKLVAIGPGLVLPLVAGEDHHGALLLLSPYARRSWTPLEQQALLATASTLALRFSRLKALTDGYSQAAKQQTMAARRHRASRPTPPWRALPRIEHGGTVVGGALPDIEQLAGELQLALQELADTRSRLAMFEGTGGPRSPLEAAPDAEAITSLAQELRQPLSSILGYTELLLGDSVGRLGPSQRQFVERIRTGVDRLRLLLGDLVQVTALEMGEITFDSAPNDMLHCVEEAVSQVGSTLKEKDLGLRLDFPDQVPAVMGDQAALVQILSHLLSNAAGASPEGAEIAVTARTLDSEPTGFLLISVRDSGEGISPEDLGRVFEPVYRADSTPVSGLGDNGVGLALVKALSEELSGRVWVESQPNEGSTLSVLLPLASPEPAGVPESSPAVA